MSNDDIFYPEPKIRMLPGAGETFNIRYTPGNESNFVIVTNDVTSAYSNKLSCTKLLTQIAEAQTIYRFDPSNRGNKRAYAKLLRRFLKEPCDTNTKKAYEQVLKQLND
jgi:hypothetical protein